MRQQDRIIAARSCSGNGRRAKIGRAETSTDPAPMNMTRNDRYIQTKGANGRRARPKTTSCSGSMTKLQNAGRYKHLDAADSQPHRYALDRHPHAGGREGVRYGSRRPSKRSPLKSSACCDDVPGAVDLYAERITGAPYLEIHVNRTAAARYGINVGDAQDVIETAIGGKNLTTSPSKAVNGFPCGCATREISAKTSEAAARTFWSTGHNGTQIPLRTDR